VKVSELKTAAQFVTASFGKNRLQNIYKEFHLAVENILRNKQAEPLETQKEQLYAVLSAIDLSVLPIGVVKILEAYDAPTYLGIGAVRHLEGILRDEHFDPITAADKVKLHFEGAQKLQQTAAKITPLLTPFKSDDPLDIEPEEAVIQLSFENGVSVDKFIDLDAWTHKWAIILRAFGLISGEPVDTARVVYAQKASPLVLEIAAAVAVVVPLAKSFTYVLDRTEQLLKIKKLHLETKQLGLQNENLEQEFESEIEKHKENTADEISKQVIKESNEQKLNDNETLTAVRQAVSTIYGYIENGGKVDCYLPPAIEDVDGETENQEERSEILSTFLRLRELEHDVEELKQLPNINDNDN